MSVSINVKDVVKKYGDITIIPDLSTTIKKRRVFHTAWTFRLRKDNITENDSRI